MAGSNAVRRMLVFMMVPLFAASLAMAQSENPAWVEELENQLAISHECKVVEFLIMHEGKLGGRDMYTARVRCADRRMYDAYKLEPQEEFLIKQCEVVVC